MWKSSAKAFCASSLSQSETAELLPTYLRRAANRLSSKLAVSSPVADALTCRISRVSFGSASRIQWSKLLGRKVLSNWPQSNSFWSEQPSYCHNWPDAGAIGAPRRSAISSDPITRIIAAPVRLFFCDVFVTVLELYPKTAMADADWSGRPTKEVSP